MNFRSVVDPLRRPIVGFFVFLALLAVAWFGFVEMLYRHTELPPAKMFRLAFRQPIPPTVTEVQGSGSGHSGFSFLLRFHASEADLQLLLDRDRWVPVAWADVRHRFAIENARDARKFRPAWAPESVGTKEVYAEKNPGQKQWVSNFHLLVDRSTGTVYCAGLGL